MIVLARRWRVGGHFVPEQSGPTDRKRSEAISRGAEQMRKWGLGFAIAVNVAMICWSLLLLVTENPGNDEQFFFFCVGVFPLLFLFGIWRAMRPTESERLRDGIRVAELKVALLKMESPAGIRRA